MVYQTFKRAVQLTLVTSAAVTAFGASTVANAQDEDQEEIERIIVTGSRIERTDEGPLPVTTITQEQIQRTGAATAEQFLQTLSIAVQGNTNVVAASAAGVISGGVSSVSLRGLGSQRTLVLVNGRRLSGGGTITDSTTVDINSIPISAVQRVEVLKEGASSVYGSDAIAGVINFILREDFEGAEVSAFGGNASGGASIMRGSAALGFGNLDDNGYNVLLVANYQNEDPLFGADRDFARSGINAAALNDTTSGNTFPANILAVNGAFGTTNPLAGNCAPSVVSPLFGEGVCRYDPSPFVSLVPDTERWNAYTALRFALTENTQLYAEASYNHNEQRMVIQPIPVSDQFALPENNPLFNTPPYNGVWPNSGGALPVGATTIVLQPSSPHYPTAFVQAQTGGATPDLLVRYRSFITGDRDVTDTAKQPRGVVGIKGALAGWNYDAGFLYSETKLTEHVNNGYPLYSQILPILNSGQVNFFGANTAEVQTLADATQFRGDSYSTKTSIGSFSASVSRELMRMSAGMLAAAFGAERRKERFSTDPHPDMQSGDISGYGGNFFPIGRDRDVTALFGELSIPILPGLEAGLAVRYDDYENTGSKTVPRANLRWQPVDQLLVRASYGRGFRAPSLTELYQPQVLGVTAPGLNDPLRCGVADANGVVNEDARDCVTQFPITFGGNTALVPEESDNYTLGVVFQPTADASLGFDAFRVKLKDTIIFGVQPVAILADPAQFGNLVTRGPPDAGTPGLPGHIIDVEQINLNFGETKLQGVDADLRWRLPIGAGHFTATLIGSYIYEYEVQNPDGTFTDISGQVSPIVNGSGGVIPEWHHYFTLAWGAGPFELAASHNFQSSYTDIPGTFEDPSDPAFKPRDVASYSTVDLYGGYSGIKNLRIQLGLRNVLDKDPPYTNAGGQNFFQAGYDPGYVDPRGRFYYATLTYSFD